MDTKEIKFIVSNIAPFNKLKEKEIDKFISLCEVKEYKNREIIYSEGGQPDYFYLLLSGRVVALTTCEGKEGEIERLKRGTCFGMISILTGEPHSVTARSIEQTSILRVDRERFKNFLNKHPLFFAEFFRLFSQRVKRRSQPKKIFRCKRIAVLGTPRSGKTTYMYNLGLQLCEQTGKKVIVLELSSQDEFSLYNFNDKREKKILALDAFKEDNAQGYVIHDRIDFISVKAVNSLNFEALLNFFSENYHFVIYEVPYDILKRQLHDFTYSADFLHLLFSLKKRETPAAAVFIRKLQRINSINKEKIRVILNSFFQEQSFSLGNKRKILGAPVYATLCSCQHGEYFKTIRRISRQIGEVVTGLALGSGGAYAFSHIGVLKVLEENNIPIDIICGSSMGSLVAALWAAGFNIEEIERSVKWVSKKLSLFPFTGISLPFKGFLRAKRLEKIFWSIFKDKTFYDLKHNLKIVAFDFIRRETKILEEGFLYKAVAASCAMPGMFEPVRFKKDILLDGGVLNPLPTRILLNYGAHKIIAVNITPTRDEIVKGYRHNLKFHILDFIFGSIETMQREFIEQSLKISDVVIHPNFGGIGGWMEFEKADGFIRKGVEAAREKIEEVKKLLAA